MKRNFKILFVFINIFIFINYAGAADNDYPKTKEERKADEMGSLLGGRGLIFTPGKIKNDSTKSNINSSTINKYLWQAAIETINFAPLASIDSIGGVIITEWYSPKNKANFSFKINIYIKDNVISPDAIEVKVFERTLKNGTWIYNDKPSDLNYTLEDKILRRARELYISANQKK